MRRIIPIFIGLALMGTASSCGFYHAKGQPDVQSFSQSDASYAGVSAHIFSRHCIACHNSSSSRAGVVLDNYGAVKASLARIEDVALIKQTMPPSHPLDADSRQLLRAWIDAGAPEGGKARPPLPALEAKFSSIRALVFEAKCTSCHTPGADAERVSLVDYSSLLNSPRELVLPGNAAESGLILAIERSDSGQMPPKRSGIPRLSEQDITTIKTWIENGAKND